MHNPERETSTAAVKTKFDGLTAPAYFDAQEKNLTDLAAREDRALAELLVTSRNYRLLNVISPATTSDNRTAAVRLRSQVEEDLATSFGGRKLSAQQIQLVTTAPFLAQTASENLPFQREMVADRAKEYKESGGTEKVDCKSVRSASPAANTPYANLKSACDALYDAQREVENCTLGAVEGALHALCIEGAELRNFAAAQDRKARLAAAEKALKKTMQANPAASSGECTGEVEGGVAKADAVIAQAAALPEDERLKTILAEIETNLATELDATIDKLVQDARAEVDRPSVTRIDGALCFLGVAQDVASASAKPAADHASAILIGLAKIRHDINLLDLDIATRKQEADIVDQQAALLRRQIYFLAQAQKALDSGAATKPDRADAEGVTFYVRSLDAGRHPYELLRFRRSQLLRSAALKRARITEEDYRRLVQPAIDQIAAYGAGGIKAETIADLLSGLPVAGSILTE